MRRAPVGAPEATTILFFIAAMTLVLAFGFLAGRRWFAAR
jgi:hypothetical protein